MATLDSFIQYLTQQLTNHSIYVWGAQGQNDISEAWIKKMETSAANANRAIAYWHAQVAAGYGNVLRAFDCSGLAVYFLKDLTFMISQDMSANSLMGKCDRISRTSIRRGDWTFRIYNSGDQKGEAYHIGYVVDDALNVIEAKGRDSGVYQSHIDSSPSYWNAYGRPSYFKDEITDADSGTAYRYTRALMLQDPMMQGDDVLHLQQALIEEGFSVGSSKADGIYGHGTVLGVKNFQAVNRFTVDGIAGKKTILALGGIWAG